MPSLQRWLVVAGLILAPTIATRGQQDTSTPPPKPTSGKSAPSQTAAPSDPLPADVATPSAESLRGLVRQLGSESFAEREKAENVLREHGLASREVLNAGLQSGDLQIRRTCRRLLNDILDLDYHRRLDRFLSDEQGRFEHDLPGWNRFRELAGDDADARRLFGEMHQEEGPLMISAEAGNAAVAEALQLRLHSIYQAMRQRGVRQRVDPAVGAVTALLFVASAPELDLPEPLTSSNYWLQLVNSNDYRTTLLQDQKSQSPARKILGRWVLCESAPQLLNQKLRLATQHQLPEGIVLALDTLAEREDTPPSYVCYAIEALGKLGDDTQQSTARIAKLLDDERVVSRQVVNKVPVEIQVRDVALGWLVHLTGQDHEDYKLPRAKTVFNRLKDRPLTYSISYTYMRFDKTEDREPALAKWADWVEEHPLPEVKPDEDAESR